VPRKEDVNKAKYWVKWCANPVKRETENGVLMEISKMNHLHISTDWLSKPIFLFLFHTTHVPYYLLGTA